MQINTLKFSILLSLSFISSLAFADYALGVQYYKLGQFDKALREFQYTAVMGESNSQLNLGIMYFRGESVPKDNVTAYKWLKLAATDEQEKFTLAFTTLKTQMTAAEIADGDKKYAELEKSLTDVEQRDRLMPTPDVKLQQHQAVKIIKDSRPGLGKLQVWQPQSGRVRLSFSVAADGTARNIHVEIGDPTFNAVAIEALHRAQFSPEVAHGKPIESYNQYRNYSFILAQELIPERAKEYLLEYEQKAQQGAAEDIYQYALQTDVIESLADNLTAFKKSKIKFANSYSLYRQAAIKGFPLAEYRLGSPLRGGMHKANMVMTLSWLERAASHNVPGAQFLLGAEYLCGYRVEKDELKGIYWLDKASAAGYANARIKLAWFYATHPDPKARDAVKAKAYFDLTTEQHLDQLSYWETKAAVLAVSHDFVNAVIAQQNAIATAQTYGLELPKQKNALAKYQEKIIWTES